MPKMVHWLSILGKVGIGMLLALTVIASAEDSQPTEQTNGVPLPQLPAATSKATDSTEGCVEPTDVMRRMHGTFLKHHRDETMYRGIRTEQHSLIECINCHVSKDAEGHYPEIDTSDHFCNGCHSYTAVQIDCFQCHASRPESFYEDMDALKAFIEKTGKSHH